MVNFLYSSSPFGAAAGQDNDIDLSVFPAIASPSKCINCQYQLPPDGFLSGASPAMPQPPPCGAGHCQCSPSAPHSSQGSPAEMLNQHGRWEVLGALGANTYPNIPIGPARRDGLALA